MVVYDLIYDKNGTMVFDTEQKPVVHVGAVVNTFCAEGRLINGVQCVKERGEWVLKLNYSEPNRKF